MEFGGGGGYPMNPADQGRRGPWSPAGRPAPQPGPSVCRAAASPRHEPHGPPRGGGGCPCPPDPQREGGRGRRAHDGRVGQARGGAPGAQSTRGRPPCQGTEVCSAVARGPWRVALWTGPSPASAATPARRGRRRAHSHDGLGQGVAVQAAGAGGGGGRMPRGSVTSLGCGTAPSSDCETVVKAVGQRKRRREHDPLGPTDKVEGSGTAVRALQIRTDGHAAAAPSGAWAEGDMGPPTAPPGTARPPPAYGKHRAIMYTSHIFAATSTSTTAVTRSADTSAAVTHDVASTVLTPNVSKHARTSVVQ